LYCSIDIHTQTWGKEIRPQAYIPKEKPASGVATVGMLQGGSEFVVATIVCTAACFLGNSTVRLSLLSEYHEGRQLVPPAVGAKAAAGVDSSATETLLRVGGFVGGC